MIRSWARTTFQSLSNRDYRILWIGTTIAFLVFTMMSIVQSVVAFEITGKNGAVGAVALGMGVSTIAVSPFGGVIADRISKRKLLLIGQSTMALTFLTVGTLIVTDRITIGALIGATFITGLVFSFIAPARQAWVGELLSKDEIGNGIALQQVGMTATRVLGPFLAGGLVAISFIGSAGTYLVMGGMMGIVVATLAQLPPTKNRDTDGGPGVLDDLRLGVAHITQRPRLLLLALSFMGVVIFGYSYQVILPGFLDELGRRPEDVAWMFGVGAVAGLFVTVGVAGQASGPNAWSLMLAGGVLLGLSLIATAAAGTFTLALVGMLFAGAGSSAFQMLNNALVMQESAAEYYGRVMSLTMLAWGLNGLAGLPFGLLADGIGERQTLVVMGVAVMLVTVVTLLAERSIRRGGGSGLGRRMPEQVAATESVRPQ
ncbi:MAG: MFS transporter [Dehalococcoidia bacterium]|nr:MFS transporter [Dehalococcoidia bacterium]